MLLQSSIVLGFVRALVQAKVESRVMALALAHDKDVQTRQDHGAPKNYMAIL